MFPAAIISRDSHVVNIISTNELGLLRQVIIETFRAQQKMWLMSLTNSKFALAPCCHVLITDDREGRMVSNVTTWENWLKRICLTLNQVRVCNQKFPDWLPGARTANDAALCHYFVSQSSEFCRHNTSCCFSTSAYCCYFITDSVRILLDTPSYQRSFKHWSSHCRI
jgi:hypothetical protein